MIQFISVDDFKIWRQGLDPSQTIAFIPTMGALHDGHFSLILNARRHCDLVVVSIFVNPGQFGPSEDFSVYPRTLAEDLDHLTAHNVDVVLTPNTQSIYPEGFDFATRIKVPKVSSGLCAKSRPHFFEGVCSVVMRFLQIVRPNVMVLGEKDYQQLVVIKKMALDLFVPVQILGCPIVREVDGLALSSRNRYLSSTDRQTASAIYASMSATQSRVIDGVIRTQPLIEFCRLELVRSGVKVDYIQIRSGVDLLPLRAVEPGCRLLVAGWVGQTRLIDNIELVSPLSA